ncbi:Spy/CpxP family protein refolding chaperone [Dyella silvatica]|uniref:Spy/CpxP family protein refolding chaperone n=1 Tax=Dyella silvatica TaxID=2992128 RepID=UPI00224EAA83|nr:Spy/CpxP family protein refolding chaperone [Dyella silvatica]
MNKVLRIVAVPTLLSLAIGAQTAWAQQASTAASPATNPPSAETRAQKHEDAVERRIGELHTKLKITDAQAKPWDAFAQTMRDNAQKADQAFRDRAQKLSTMNADDAMKSYADIAQLHADNMKKMSAAMSDLYAVLSVEQKQIADALYRNKDESSRQGPHKHKGHGPASASSVPATAN